MTNYRNDQENNPNSQTRAGIIRREQKLSIALPSMYNTLIKMHADNTARVNAAGAAALANRQEAAFNQVPRQPEKTQATPAAQVEQQPEQLTEAPELAVNTHEYEIPRSNGQAAEIYNQDEATQLKLDALAKIAAIHNEAEGAGNEFTA